MQARKWAARRSGPTRSSPSTVSKTRSSTSRSSAAESKAASPDVLSSVAVGTIRQSMRDLRLVATPESQTQEADLARGREDRDPEPGAGEERDPEPDREPALGRWLVGGQERHRGEAGGEGEVARDRPPAHLRARAEAPARLAAASRGDRGDQHPGEPEHEDRGGPCEGVDPRGHAAGKDELDRDEGTRGQRPGACGVDAEGREGLLPAPPARDLRDRGGDQNGSQDQPQNQPRHESRDATPCVPSGSDPKGSGQGVTMSKPGSGKAKSASSSPSFSPSPSILIRPAANSSPAASGPSRMIAFRAPRVSEMVASAESSRRPETVLSAEFS